MCVCRRRTDAALSRNLKDAFQAIEHSSSPERVETQCAAVSSEGRRWNCRRRRDSDPDQLGRAKSPSVRKSSIPLLLGALNDFHKDPLTPFNPGVQALEMRPGPISRDPAPLAPEARGRRSRGLDCEGVAGSTHVWAMGFSFA